MSKVVGVGNLADAVQGILEKYGEEAADVIREVAPEAGKTAQRMLRATSPTGSSSRGPYAKGWSMQTQNTRMGVKVVVHNKNKPGLTHLLEHGHALRNGGRARAIPHIAAANAKAQEDFLAAVEKGLEAIKV